MDRTEPYTEEEIISHIRDEEFYYKLKEKQMKTAQIEAVELKNTWTSKRGETMYTHTVTLSNGETGDINAKSELPEFLKVGETLNYNSMEDKFGKKFTRIQLQDPGTPSHGAFKKGQDWEDPERQKKIIRQSSLAQAVAYFSGKTATDGQVLALAEKFETWVNR